MLTTELEHFALDISNAVNANKRKLTIVNILGEDFNVVTPHLKEKLTGKNVLFFNKESMSLSPVIDMAREETAGVDDVLVINANNSQDHTYMEIIGFNGKKMADVDAKEILVTHDVTIYQGDNYFGEEIL